MMDRLRKNKFQLNSQPKISGKDRNKSVLSMNVVCRSNKLCVCMIAFILLTAGPHWSMGSHPLCVHARKNVRVCAPCVGAGKT